LRGSDLFGAVLVGAALLASSLVYGAVKAAPFEKWGTRFGVDPKLLRKIAQVESGGDAGARRLVGGDAERGGAWGLMQMTLATADALASKFPTGDTEIAANLARFERLGATALLSPDINVMFGAFHVTRLLEQFDGNELMAVGAYNRGARGMRNLVASGGNPGTLQYVQKVMAA
jgi:soluble lytic murein transglycosylase-like protein